MSEARDVSIEIVVRENGALKYEHTVHAPNLNAARAEAGRLVARFYEEPHQEEP